MKSVHATIQNITNLEVYELDNQVLFMIKKYFNTFFLFTSGFIQNAAASDLILDGFFPLELNKPIIMNCQGLSITPKNELTQCSNTDEFIFDQCPTLAIDDYSYSVGTEFLIYNENRLITIQSAQLENCISDSTGQSPSKTGEFMLVIGNSTFGLSDLFIDVDSWTLVTRSSNRDIRCDNATPFTGDLIFLNGFEGQ